MTASRGAKIFHDDFRGREQVLGMYLAMSFYYDFKVSGVLRDIGIILYEDHTHIPAMHTRFN